MQDCPNCGAELAAGSAIISTLPLLSIDARLREEDE